jgi:DNA-binding FadR family transcriptional regulator
VSRSSLFIKAQAQLRDYIKELGLGPGDRLPSEADLAARFGVSRAAIREATRSLQTLGVIKARHGDGLYVANFSFRPIIEQLPYGLTLGSTQFVEILQAREALEMGLMPAVSVLASDAHLETCSALAARMAELESSGESTIDVDRAFHLQLYTSLNNPLVDNLIEVFWELYRRLDATLPVAAHHAPVAPRHSAIVEALTNNEPELAMRRMREHFDDVRTRAQALASDS